MDSDDLPLSRATVDRDGLTRSDPAALAARYQDPRLRMVAIRDGQIRVHPEHDAVDLSIVPPGEGPNVDDEAATTPQWLYLGQDEDGPVVARALPDDPTGEPASQYQRWMSLREVGAFLPARDAGLATAAIALNNWHRSHTRCPRCGQATQIVAGGWVRHCRRDDSEHYPRTDPAVIMAIVDAADRLLLAHNAMWPSNRYSVPAGYVEPGESLEAAVRREVHEETAVTVGTVVYQGSQPWPFPASLMLAFRGHASTTTPIPDGEELTDAGFYTREELAAHVRTGAMALPGAASIAHGLIRDWYGQDLPEPSDVNARP